MLISHRKRFIYTKTVKTGGTSVESYFERYCMPDGEWTPSHYRDEYESAAGVIGYRGPNRPQLPKWWNHMGAGKIREQIGDEVWSSYLKFCVVRNPYEKCVSDYFFREGWKQISSAASPEDPENFSRWLEIGKPSVDRGVYTIDGRICMDVFLRYENLHADIEQLCGRIGVPWEPDQLPQYKSGVRPAWGTVAALYTPRAREFVERVYAFELREFGYSFPA